MNVQRLSHFLWVLLILAWSGCATGPASSAQQEDDAVDRQSELLWQEYSVAVEGFAQTHEWWRDDDILREPDVRAYPYASHAVRALAELGYRGELDERYNSGNAWASFSYLLVRQVIPNCPPEKLDSEHAYWEQFWRDHKQQVEHPQHRPGPRTDCATRPLPWGIVAAAFAARRKDVQGVRQAFQLVALEIPKIDVNVWGGSCGNQRFERLVPLYLKAAGDPQWDNWEPEFSGPEKTD